MNYRETCPICASHAIAAFLFREHVPVHQNLVMRDQKSAIAISRGNLDLAFCKECGFIFNRAFDINKIMYGEEYDNTQAYSPSFNNYLDKLANHLVNERGVQNCRVVEVGCGKGLFLRKLIEFENAGNIGYGFDPSYVGEELSLNGRLRFEKRYYNSECADVSADIVVCRHVVEHVPSPLNLLRDIKKALSHSPNARIFFETPCVEWILRNQVIWDFFYEHCSYFTATSLTTAFEITGFKVESVQHVFNGQYLWLEATIPPIAPSITKQPGLVPLLADKFVRLEDQLKHEWEVKIERTAAKEEIALWGAGAKGVTFANLIDPKRRWINCLVDLNPQKQDHYVPGTGHPIVCYRSLPNYSVTTAFLMNPNYRDENLSLLREANLHVNLI